MFARLPQQMWTVDMQLTSSGKLQKGKCLELVPFKVAGKLLEVNDLSLQIYLLSTGTAIPIASSLKVLAWLTHETKFEDVLCTVK